MRPFAFHSTEPARRHSRPPTVCALAAGLALLTPGCPRWERCPPPPQPDAAVADAGAADAGIDADVACTPPRYDGRPIVYANGIARPIDPAGDVTPFVAVIDAETRELVDYILLTGACRVGVPYVDMAVASDGSIVLSGSLAFVRLDPATGECTTLRETVIHDPGTDMTWFETVPAPLNLTFVPAGVLDPTREMMAALGYHFLDQPRQLVERGFFRYDPANAREELVYEWPDDLALSISGDIVVVTDYCTGAPRAYATMTGDRAVTHCHPCQDGETPGVDCGDCLYSFDIRHGTLSEEVALLPSGSVFGLALFGDALFGFSTSGRIFAISAVGGAPAVAEIPVTPPAGYASVSFDGAGSTSAAPFVF